MWCFILIDIFIFKLAYLNNTRWFYCAKSIHTYSVLWTSSHPSLHSNFLPPPPSSSLRWVSLYCFHVCVHTYIIDVNMWHTSILSTPQCSFLLPSSPTNPLRQSRHIHSCSIILFYHHHQFSSMFHKWARTCNNWPFELVLHHSAWYLQFYPFSYKWYNFIIL
jgi:hypothetical protein